MRRFLEMAEEQSKRLRGLAFTSNMEKSQQECTHNCMTCGAGCSEQGGDGVGKLEKTLNALADIDTEELLKALNEMNQE